ncbi:MULTISPECIES: helix-turn-helix domain-containing protein [Enterococcus]|uniref:helix-turn-helix domain-containing protein n=1 Tax=Enterococcus TaxID=1350 RepID=UPI000DEAD00E|nr:MULTISPECIES: helix-turn-helix transcriptional regulator [Enterococcus]EGP4729571.1 helix-turn-helix transcriptional regulator [Enterococcus faecium]EGP4995642.1 helix-turn-helix transcriptional regulator [Enterococcus faecium]EGP5509869.1 helix-turn-helix domain-containing protein [Enterococcus faecium]EHV2947222.1 helix-turn-helix transcriptional regulator [Enterococcus faecium]EME3488776.1 helix-turn-helix transcriptional regulator [Enterococcus faecium]
MTTFERVKMLADKRKISIVELEEKLNFSKNSLYAWKKSKPSIDKLNAVADYFNVSTDYLLGRTDDPNIGVASEKRKLTVEEALASVMSSDGKPLTDNDREILSAMIEAYLEKKDN